MEIFLNSMKIYTNIVCKIFQIWKNSGFFHGADKFFQSVCEKCLSQDFRWKKREIFIANFPSQKSAKFFIARNAQFFSKMDFYRNFTKKIFIVKNTQSFFKVFWKKVYRKKKFAKFSLEIFIATFFQNGFLSQFY